MAVQSAPLGSDRHWLALAVNVVSQFMVVLDTAIVNVALPSIKSDLLLTGKPPTGDHRLRDLLRRSARRVECQRALRRRRHRLAVPAAHALRYSPIKTGVVYIALTLTTIVFTQVTQAVVTRVGVRTVLPAGFALSTAAFVLYARLTVHGHYFPDLFPAFVISGLGLAVVFVPMSIGALTGVRPVDAGIASGLFNTNVQIGGAIGVAAAITLATTATENFGGSHAGISAFTGAALTYGFDVGFRVLAATAAVGAVIAAFMLESRPSAAEPEPEVAHAALEPGSAA